jgi:hypothetical protein
MRITKKRRVATAAEVWAILRENAKRQAEWQAKWEKEAEEREAKWRKEAEERQKEAEELEAKRQKEAEERQKEAEKQRKEADRQMKAMRKEVSRLGSKAGEIAEHIIGADLVRKFNRFGYKFNQMSRRRIYKDADGRDVAEVDIFLENGEYALAVEVKMDLKVEGIQDHCNRLETLKRLAEARGDKRKYLGAAAGGIISKQAREYALKNGFYLIEPSGETARITAPENPRIW